MSKDVCIENGWGETINLKIVSGKDAVDFEIVEVKIVDCYGEASLRLSFDQMKEMANWTSRVVSEYAE